MDGSLHSDGFIRHEYELLRALQYVSRFVTGSDPEFSKLRAFKIYLLTPSALPLVPNQPQLSEPQPLLLNHLPAPITTTWSNPNTIRSR